MNDLTPPSSSLKPRLIKGMQATYIASKWEGESRAGLTVHGKNVLVLTDECSPKTAGGVELPPDLIDRMNEASVTGVVCGVGADAFRRFDDGALWVGPKPELGDRIVFEKYAGVLVRGADERMYRILDFRAVAATIIPGSED